METFDLDFPDGPKPDDPLGIAYRAASRGKRKALKPGDSLPLKTVTALVLASGGRVIDTAQRYGRDSRLAENALCSSAPPDKPVDRSDNARSLAILFALGRFQFFDAGDLTWNIEKKLVCPFDLIGKVDLYQVTHHGMDISNHPTLVRTIAPTVAIMNNGPRKGSAPATVKLLRSIPTIEAAYQLHRNAATGPEDNTDAALVANKDAAGGTIVRVLVEPDGVELHCADWGRWGEEAVRDALADHEEPGMDSIANRRSPRRFGLRDGLILVAVLAIALSLLRSDHRVSKLIELPGWWRRVYWLPGDTRWPLGMTKPLLVRLCVGRSLKILVPVLSRILLALTLAQVSLRLLRPRPPLGHLVRQAGFVACLAAIAGYLWLWDLSCTKEVYRVCGRCPGPFAGPPWSLQESAILVIWPLVGLRPWRKDPGWLDRLGRAVGWGWVLAAGCEIVAYQFAP